MGCGVKAVPVCCACTPTWSGTGHRWIPGVIGQPASLANSVSSCFNEKPYLKTSRQKMVEYDFQGPLSSTCVLMGALICMFHIHVQHTMHTYTYAHTHIHMHTHIHASKSGFNSVPMFMCSCIPLFLALETS